MASQHVVLPARQLIASTATAVAAEAGLSNRAGSRPVSGSGPTSAFEHSALEGLATRTRRYRTRADRWRRVLRVFWHQMRVHRRITPFADVSYKVQLAAFFGTGVTVVVLVLSFVFVTLLGRTIRTDAARSLQHVADNVAHALGQGMEERYRLVQTLSTSSTLWSRGLDSPDVLTTLAAQQSQHQKLSWIGVADLDGKVRSATGGLLVGSNVSARPWFQGALERPFVGDVHDAVMLSSLLGPSDNGEPLRFVDFAASVTDHGRTVGVISVHGSWEWARNVVDSISPRDASGSATQPVQVFVFNKNGDLILAPDIRQSRQDFALQRLPKLEETSTAVAAINAIDGTSAVLRWADGVDYLTQAARVSDYSSPWGLGWTVVVRVPATVAFAEFESARVEALVAGAIAVLLSALFAWIMASRVSAPLSLIVIAAQAVQHGERGAKIPSLRTSREIAALTDSLASMTTQLIADRHDLEQRVAARTRELSRMARYDPLTDVYNRRGFDEYMTRFIAASRRRLSPLALLMVDADHFKRVNDRFGHDVGDEVLRTLAQVLKGRLRSTDVVGRFGGEEFLMLLPDTDLHHAGIVADGLIELVAKTTIPIVGGITVSCGVVVLERGEDGHSLIKRADMALYRAKSLGRNQAAFYDESASTDAS